MADEIMLDAPETRLERFLSAAAGMDGIPLDEPETRIERYLYKIAQGGGGSGGGVLVVHDVEGTLDKTWQEIYDADFAVVVQSVPSGKKKYAVTAVLRNRDNTEFLVNLIEGDPASYTASSADGYPVAE